jgi:uncharacterized membrane protein
MATEPQTDPIEENIRAVADFYSTESQKVSSPQRLLERASEQIGQPVFLALIVLFVVLWIGTNLALRALGRTQFDPPPFSLLQGIVSLGALLITTAVLARQTRLAILSHKRAHLDLKVTMLTEQKTAKLIDLLEELRRDLPNVRDRHDPQAAALRTAMNPEGVRAALDQGKTPEVP